MRDFDGMFIDYYNLTLFLAANGLSLILFTINSHFFLAEVYKNEPNLSWFGRFFKEGDDYFYGGSYYSFVIIMNAVIYAVMLYIPFASDHIRMQAFGYLDHYELFTYHGINNLIYLFTFYLQCRYRINKGKRVW